MEKWFRYKATARFERPEPWYDPLTGRPWHEEPINWSLANRNRRLIVEALSGGPLSFSQLRERLYVTLKPHLAHHDGLSLEIPTEALENHLATLESNGVVRRDGDRYVLNLPLLTLEEQEQLKKTSEELGEELAKKLRRVRMRPHWLDPLLENVTIKALQELDGDYDWEGYHPWMEEDPGSQRREESDPLLKPGEEDN